MADTKKGTVLVKYARRTGAKTALVLAVTVTAALVVVIREKVYWVEPVVVTGALTAETTKLGPPVLRVVV